MNFERMIKISSPYYWNKHFTREKFFTIHMYTKSLQDQTPQILSFHSKLLGSFQNNIQRLNNESSDSCHYDIIFDDDIKDNTLLDFVELLKAGSIVMENEIEMANISFLLSVFGLTAAIEFNNQKMTVNQEVNGNEDIIANQEVAENGEMIENEGQNVYDEGLENLLNLNDQPEIHENLDEVILNNIHEPTNPVPVLGVQKSNPEKIQRNFTLQNFEEPPKQIDISELFLRKKMMTANPDKPIDTETRDFLIYELNINDKDLRCKLCRKLFQESYSMAQHLVNLHGYSKNMSQTAQQLWFSLCYPVNPDGSIGKEMRCQFCRTLYRDNYAMREHPETTRFSRGGGGGQKSSRKNHVHLYE